MLAPLLLLWPMSVVLTWLVAQNIANRPYDRELGEMVRAIAQQASVVPAGAGGAAQGEPAHAADGHRAAARRRRRQRVLPGARRARRVRRRRRGPAGARRGAPARSASCSFRDDDDARRRRCAWPTCGWPLPGAASDTAMLVQVAETLDKRSRLANEIIKGVILPQFVILPLAVVLVWFALSRGIKPLNRAAAAHPQAREHRPEPDRRARRARRGGAAGARHQRPARPAGPVDRARRSSSWPTPRTS